MSVHWSPHWSEDIPPGEDARWEAFAQQIAKIARDVSVRTGRPVDRVFHVKQHTGVRGTLRVLAGLPAPLASGVFATPQAWPCYVRFSNGAVRKQCTDGRRCDGAEDCPVESGLDPGACTAVGIQGGRCQ